jgi:shikimate dehydrogenase
MSSVTRLGLIGAAIQQSASPALHMREAAEHGLACIYELINLDVLDADVTALPSLLSNAEARGFRGLNITHPCKQAVISYLTILHPRRGSSMRLTPLFSRTENASGTTRTGGGLLRLSGVIVSRFPESGCPDGRRRRRSAAHTPCLGVRGLTIFDLADRAASLATRLKPCFPDADISAGVNVIESLRAADGLVNATPVGMAKYQGIPVPQQCLRRDLWVADIVYVPLVTSLLHAAREAGCKTMGGGDMAIYQAVEAFRLFNGVTADSDRMRQHFAKVAKP